MKVLRATSAEEAMPPAASWWYTLAHATKPAKAQALSGAALDGLIACLEERGLPVATLLRQHVCLRMRSALAPEGMRYLWAFRSLRDAMLVAQANRRSDYHAYPHPTSLHEASLDRLYYRFPLTDFPQTTILLISGSFVCDDPLLGPDPEPHSLAAAQSTAIAPEDWGRYTLCGFTRGASLISVLPSDRWLRILPSDVEEAWDNATHQLQTHGARPTLRTVERAAVALLMRGLANAEYACVSGSTRKRRPAIPTADGHADDLLDPLYQPGGRQVM